MGLRTSVKTVCTNGKEMEMMTSASVVFLNHYLKWS